MKTPTEIKDQIAQQHGYKDFLDVLKSFDCAKSTYAEVNFIINESMQEYAKQCCDEQIKACGSRWLNTPSEDSYSPYDIILSTPNVVK